MPYQLHSKQTAAGSVGLPGTRLGEARKGKREVGRRGGKKATSRVGGEVRHTRRNCEDDERGAGEGEATETGEGESMRVHS